MRNENAARPDNEAAWLAHLLTESGQIQASEVAAVHIKERYKHHCVLEVTYSPGAPDSSPRHLILKRYDREHAAGMREAIFYSEIAAAMSEAPVPQCYGVSVDGETGQISILLQNLSATHFTPMSPFDHLTPTMFLQVVDAYLGFHTHWWDHPRLRQDKSLIYSGLGVAHEATSPAAIQAHQRYFADTALPRWFDRFGNRVPREWRAVCEQAIAAWADLFLRRTAEGRALTLIQGDAHLRNVLLPRDRGAHHPVLIDWEGCTAGIGLWDLARMLIADLPPDRRRELENMLLPRYQRRLGEAGIENYTLQDSRDDYQLCVLANIPHALEWEGPLYLVSAMQAFADWQCEALLG